MCIECTVAYVLTEILLIIRRNVRDFMDFFRNSDDIFFRKIKLFNE